MHLGRIVQAAFLSGVIGCTSTQSFEQSHNRELSEVRSFVESYNAEVRPLSVERNPDAILAIQPSLDVLRQYNLGIFPLEENERDSLAEAFTDVAAIYYDRQDCETARKYIWDAISVKNNDFRLFVFLGILNYAMHDLNGAELAFDRALSLNPFNEGAQQLLERVRYERRER
ncbi:MAG: hypothetical protein HY363_05125 [Candidatus Aenigmarchaeota archaeon]|nr:hypothetical protein [Candidatus Aenigmarchaeota archaeon]